jgi:septation ring formation regulator EzrA
MEHYGSVNNGLFDIVPEIKRVKELEQENAKLRVKLEKVKAERDRLGFDVAAYHEKYEILADDLVNTKEELERRKLKWQTGAIPETGAYFDRPYGVVTKRYQGENRVNSGGEPIEWAGPIEPPEEKE